jgi:hypothetical protein
MGRVQSGLLGPCTEREIDILHHAGVFERQLGPMPDKLREHFYMGGEYHVRYEAPLNLAQRAGAGVGIMQAIQAVGVAAQFDQDALLVMDVVKGLREVMKVGGVPADVIRSDKEIKEMKDQKQQAQDMAQMLEAAPQAASAAKDMAQASAIAASSPNQQAGQVVPA